MYSNKTQGNGHKVAGTQEMKTFKFIVKALAVTTVKARSEKEAWARFKKAPAGNLLNKAHVTAVGTKEEDVISVEETA